MLPLHLQSESHIPLYVQLRDQLRALVHSGELAHGRSHSRPAANWPAQLRRASHHGGKCLRGTRIRRADPGARGPRHIHLRRAGETNFSPPPRTNGNGGPALGIVCSPTSAARTA